MNSEIVELSARFENWLYREALPKWLTSGINRQNGAHYEALTMAGEVDDLSNIRVRVQARQTFCYAMTTKAGWINAENTTARLLEFSEDHASHLVSGGGFYHLLNADFSPKDTEEDLYDQAFFFLAYSACINAFGDNGFSDKAHALSRFLDQKMKSEHGGWNEGGNRYTVRRQNPHMHLFEAFMSLYESTNDMYWLTRANDIFLLFERYFYDSDLNVVFEFFNNDWTLAHSVEQAAIEPGHMFEWVWLLDWYSRISGTKVDHIVQPLFNKGLEIGLAPNGLVYDEVNCFGKIHQATMRSWGLTELIKAALVMHTRGDPNANAVMNSALHRLFSSYLQAEFPGGYIDQRDENNNVLSDRCPASTLYHYCALANELSTRVLNKY
ncbi:AGE family epimerase/isomerase [Gilvimarinus agarilyticus]|uniref:AGE family epimerase/isomerase n=1 Tax=Gilvimarinus sp. 2_MG-2023 TaxID=3062666 RepID=UPI001C084A64|nr:AGE family epimerase/isomerase [Gilvimarinus sp. 2_MG-2023]MBU2885638.1 AGE family epimerase/isomerase [Gilvimarinus agarilyticus]MDO6570500.1 AGE family epimerase/isomerase [Gilvimarinus sp. 2_MG-2023]